MTKHFTLILVFALLIGCKPNKEIKQQPEPIFPQAEYNNLVSEGDQHFSKMHLLAWREAENCFQKAYQMKKTYNLRDKIFITLFLMITREWNEGIINPTTYQKVEQLGEFPKSKKQQYLYTIMRHCLSIPTKRSEYELLVAEDSKNVDISLFNIKKSALEAYLYLFCLEYYYSSDIVAYNEKLEELENNYGLYQLLQKYSDSPLMIYYFKFDRVRKGFDVENEYPKFTEFLLNTALRHYSAKRFRSASVYFQRILQLIPDYTKAINGIGNIYFLQVKNYSRALEYYESSLACDKMNPFALFGKGVSLHYLKRYQESNEVFHLILENQDLYHGQAYYFKAYNWYFMKNLPNSRLFIDKAKSLLPDSGEVLFLSGLLFYKQEDMKNAMKDFLKALKDRSFSACYPRYYLGMIQFNLKDPKFRDNFKKSCTCFETRLLNMEKKIVKIDSLDLQEVQKQWMRKNLMAELKKDRVSYQKMIKQMENLLVSSPEGKKQN